MPAGQSVTGIWNIALFELGEEPVASTDAQNGRAIKCATRWNDVRQAVIRQFNWNCCKKYAQLAADPTPPPFGWGKAFTLPNDYIRHYAIMDTDGNPLDDADWEIVGNQLMTDEGGPLNIMYFFDLGDPVRMDALMVQVLGYTLALEIGPGWCRDDTRLARIEQKRKDKLANARLTASQENSSKEFGQDVLLRARR